MLSIRCHHCGGIMGEVPEIKRLHNHLTRREFSVVEAILEAGEQGITCGDLAITLFGKTLGALPNKASHVRKLVSRTRPKIEPFGFFIPDSEAHGVYRIEPLEVRA